MQKFCIFVYVFITSLLIYATPMEGQVYLYEPIARLIDESDCWSESIAFSPDGKTLVEYGWNGACVWDIAEKKIVDALIAIPSERFLDFNTACMGFLSPDTKTFVSLLGQAVTISQDDYWIDLWDIQQKVRIDSWDSTGPDSAYLRIYVSPDGSKVAWSLERYCARDDAYNSLETCILDFAAREIVRLPEQATGIVAGFHTDREILISGYSGVWLWDVEESKATIIKHDDSDLYGPLIYERDMAALSPDGEILAYTNYAIDENYNEYLRISLWDVEGRTEIDSWPIFCDNFHCEVSAIEFSPDGEILAWSERENYYNYSSYLRYIGEKENIVIPGDWKINRFSPDGGSLFLSGEDGICVWDIEAKGIKTVIDGHIVFSPEDEMAALSIRDDSGWRIHLWDIEREEVVAVLEDGAGPVAFSPDGSILASGSSVGMILLWDISPWGEITPTSVEPGWKEALTWGELKSAYGEDIVEQAKLWQNYPNPFNPETWIPFELAQESEVVLRVYDAKGSLIREISLGKKPAGSYIQRSKAIHWDGRNDSGERVASGVYFYTLQTGDYTETRKMILAE